jgi:hAT family C-terminal dimerisation region
MAINILSIPAMSADVERLFSSVGLTLSNRRIRMSPELLEALESLKLWMKITDLSWMMDSDTDNSKGNSKDT